MNKTTFTALLVSFMVIFLTTVGQSFNPTVRTIMSVCVAIISVINVIVSIIEFKENKKHNEEK